MRRGIASVVGMLFMTLIFMLAVGAQVYVSALQTQSEQADTQAQSLLSQHADERLDFSVGSAGLEVTNGGPATARLVGMILRLGNGTQYLLSTSSAPAFQQSSLSPGEQALVSAAVPTGTCSPGSETCLERFDAITGSPDSGGAVGLVTSLGNTFWYVPASAQVLWDSITGYPAACPSGEEVSQLGTSPTCEASASAASIISSGRSTSGTGVYSSTGLTATLSPDTSYAFYAFTLISPTYGTEHYDFEIHSLPSGASLLVACTPSSFSLTGGNSPSGCTSSTGTPVAQNSYSFSVTPPAYESPGVAGVVTVGATGGTLEIDFACTQSCGSVTMDPGSYLILEPLG